MQEKLNIPEDIQIVQEKLILELGEVQKETQDAINGKD
jgi:hypothetical protein